MSTREEKIEAAIAKAEARYKEAFDVQAYDLAKGVQAEILELQKNLENERQRMAQAAAAQGTNIFPRI